MDVFLAIDNLGTQDVVIKEVGFAIEPAGSTPREVIGRLRSLDSKTRKLEQLPFPIRIASGERLEATIYQALVTHSQFNQASAYLLTGADDYVTTGIPMEEHWRQHPPRQDPRTKAKAMRGDNLSRFLAQQSQSRSSTL